MSERRTRRAVLAAAIALLVALVAFALAGSASTHRRSSTPSATHAEPRARVQPQSHLQRPAPARRRSREQAVATGSALERVLAYTSYIRLGGHRRPDVALTFDDGPSPYTIQIVRILRRTHTPATFFVIGRWARAYPSIIAQEVRAGAEIGDHTETHAFLSLLSPALQESQIAAAATAITAAEAPAPRLFRPPYGAFDRATLQILRARRMLMVLWSADTKDYARPGVARIIYAGISAGQPGAIILMHDGGGDRSETVAALPRIILRLRQRGFRLVTVSQLIADDPPPVGQPPPLPLSGRG
jgi:peptidoglycan/xylan/chitin deacetylase (PgdA/CDA1 family)